MANSTVPEEQPMVRINVDKIPPWVAEYLAEGLYRAVRDFYSVPENMAKFEKWKAERDARLQAEGGREAQEPEVLCAGDQ